MKVYKSQLVLPMRWVFSSTNGMLRSNVVGKYQCEIYQGMLFIVSSAEGVVYSKPCRSRLRGIAQARKVLTHLILGVRQS